MSARFVWLADELQFDDAIRALHRKGGDTRDLLILCGALLLITLLILVWAVFVRKRRRQRATHYAAPRHGQAAPKDRGDALPVPHQRRRHRRRAHRPLNPTLAQTRGLPPPRTEGPEESAY